MACWSEAAGRLWGKKGWEGAVRMVGDAWDATLRLERRYNLDSIVTRVWISTLPLSTKYFSNWVGTLEAPVDAVNSHSVPQSSPNRPNPGKGQR